jgi:hypothetical protein
MGFLYATFAQEVVLPDSLEEFNEDVHASL